MGNADPNKTKAGNKYEVKPHPSQLGGRHSNPVVTTPTIALDFSDTTQQPASHNVAPNQAVVDSSIRSTTGRETPSSACTKRPDEISADGFSSKSWPEQLRRGAAETAPGGNGGGDDLERREASKNPPPMLNTLSSVSVRESRIQYLCDPQWFRDTASRGPTTIVAPKSQFRTCPSDHGKSV
ncbi:dr1-associated corepressor [Dorcoceras hygrometricum]|uniref:Dr1-associated corepressor n=1 Tax=Dorcoceras hygrometricum TaxID=472368 RepID=A0A2Z7D0P0_9LAMI|nr:dr1-associated corepressor [Dorcoceras hygrometricum]